MFILSLPKPHKITEEKRTDYNGNVRIDIVSTKTRFYEITYLGLIHYDATTEVEYLVNGMPYDFINSKFIETNLYI